MCLNNTKQKMSQTPRILSYTSGTSEARQSQETQEKQSLNDDSEQEAKPSNIS